MATNDSRRVIQVNPDKAAKPKIANLTELNTALKQIVEMVYTQEGRAGSATVRDTLVATGQNTAALQLKSFTFTDGFWEFGFMEDNGDHAYMVKGATFNGINSNGSFQMTAKSPSAIMLEFDKGIFAILAKTGLQVGQPFVFDGGLLSFNDPSLPSGTMGLHGNLIVNGDARVNGTLTATPSNGRYEKTANTAGTGLYDWDTTITTGSFTLSGGNTILTCTLAGTYHIHGIAAASITANTAGAVDLEINGTNVQRSQIFNADAAVRTHGFPITYTLPLIVGDTVQINASTGITTRVGNANHPTTLVLTRLG